MTVRSWPLQIFQLSSIVEIDWQSHESWVASLRKQAQLPQRLTLDVFLRMRGRMDIKTIDWRSINCQITRLRVWHSSQNICYNKVNMVKEGTCMYVSDSSQHLTNSSSTPTDWGCHKSQLNGPKQWGGRLLSAAEDNDLLDHLRNREIYLLQWIWEFHQHGQWNTKKNIGVELKKGHAWRV